MIKCSNPLLRLNENHKQYSKLKHKYSTFILYDHLKKNFQKLWDKYNGGFEKELSRLIKEKIFLVSRCRRCLTCVNHNRYIWTTRLYEESLKWERAYFITLTFKDEYLTYNDKNQMTLTSRDYQLFFKRLRKSGYKFKYLISGEYGPKNQRPHYHILLFTNDIIDDMVFFKNSKSGVPIYISFTIDKAWHNQGFTAIQPVESADVVSYLTLYSSKNLTRQSINDNKRWYLWKQNEYAEKLLNEKLPDDIMKSEFFTSFYLHNYESRKPEFVQCSNGFVTEYRYFENTPTYLLRKIKDKDERAAQLIQKRNDELVESLSQLDNFAAMIESNKIYNKNKSLKNSKNDI